MNKSVKPEFDQYAEEYTNLHRANIRISGEDPAFFAAYKAGYMAAWLGDDARTKPLSILDFGCGVGNTITHLRKGFPAASLHGADLSGESIRLATQSHFQEATFSTIENTRLPYEDESFDIVMAACVSSHTTCRAYTLDKRDQASAEARWPRLRLRAQHAQSADLEDGTGLFLR